MATILIKGEAVRKAVRWISDQLSQNPDSNIHALADNASLTFDLSQKQMEQLRQFYIKKNKFLIAVGKAVPQL